MIGSIFQDFASWLNSISGTSAEMRWNFSGAYNVEAKITALNGSIISPYLPIQDTKFTLTMFDISKKDKDRRIAGIDNHENKLLHQHFNGSESYISGTYNIADVGSRAFLGLFPNVF